MRYRAAYTPELVSTKKDETFIELAELASFDARSMNWMHTAVFLIPPLSWKTLPAK